jgi:hypothetical protein
LPVIVPLSKYAFDRSPKPTPKIPFPVMLFWPLRSPWDWFEKLTPHSAFPDTSLADDVRARDFSIEKPVPKPVFDAYKALYSYDKTDLDARVDSTGESAEHWRIERVSSTPPTAVSG